MRDLLDRHYNQLTFPQQLEEENRQLKRMVADLSLDKQMLQDVLAKMYGPPRVCKTNNWRGKSGLRKCIRPVYGTRRCLAMMEIRMRLAYLVGTVSKTAFLHQA